MESTILEFVGLVAPESLPITGPVAAFSAVGAGVLDCGRRDVWSCSVDAAGAFFDVVAVAGKAAKIGERTGHELDVIGRAWGGNWGTLGSVEGLLKSDALPQYQP